MFSQEKESPKLFFKYKPVTTKSDLIRVYDILKNHRLYYPRYFQLNDPLEGASLQPLIITAGLSIIKATDDDLPAWKNIKEQYRILSLSSDCFSPQLWAYYCNNYNGICLCYKSGQSFSCAAPVSYYEKELTMEDEIAKLDDKDYVAILEANLHEKQKGWSVEQEWRIVENDKVDYNYFDYSQDELLAIVFGHNIDPETLHFLKDIIPPNIQLFKTHPGLQTRKIAILPSNHKIMYDGSPPPFIYDTDTLYKTLTHPQDNLS